MIVQKNETVKKHVPLFISFLVIHNSNGMQGIQTFCIVNNLGPTKMQFDKKTVDSVRSD